MTTVGLGRVRLSRDLVTTLLAHADAELPNEACGLLAGDPATATVAAFHPARNEHASPYRFSLDPRDLVRITYAIEEAGQELVAIFHSHPNGEARPSTTDVREARYPMALHLLVGLPSGQHAEDDAGWSLRAWRITEGGCNEVGLSVG